MRVTQVEKVLFLMSFVFFLLAAHNYYLNDAVKKSLPEPKTIAKVPSQSVDGELSTQEIENLTHKLKKIREKMEENNQAEDSRTRHKRLSRSK